MSFSAQINRFVDHAKSNTGKLMDGVTYNLLDVSIDRTPFGRPALWKRKPPPGYEPGRLRGGWGVNGSESSMRIDAAGDKAKSAARATVEQTPFDAERSIRNPVPYGAEIEQGGGEYLTPPNKALYPSGGIIGLAKAEFQSVVRQEHSKLGVSRV